MRLFTRLLVCMAMALMLSAALFSMAGSWFGEKANLLRLGREVLFEMRRSQALSERSEIVFNSMVMKRDIIVRLLAGRLNLREAICQFQEANERIENADLHLVPEFHKPTDPQGVGRQVLAWVRSEVTTWPPDRDKRIVQSMEKEFHELFGANDTGEYQ